MRWRIQAMEWGSAACFFGATTITVAASMATTTLHARQSATPRAVVLNEIRIDGDNERVEITLVANGPITGRLQRIPGGVTRLFVDLNGVRPQVDAVKAVNRGPVLRVRTGLHSVDPIITRVVLDVSTIPTARIEQGATSHQLRIVVGTGTGAMASADAASAASLDASDKQWWLDIARRIEVLLTDNTAQTSQPAMTANAAGWEQLEKDVSMRQGAGLLQPIAFTLLQSVRLGRIATAHHQARQFDQGNAARSGARLLLETALTRLETLK